MALGTPTAPGLRSGLLVWETPDMADSVLRSRRVVLRPLRWEDAEHVAALLGNDRDAILQMSHMPYPCTLESAREWIGLRTQPGAITLAVTRVEDGAFLGAIGFGGLPEMPGVGYWIGRQYWNQGYATEALQVVIAHVRGLGAKGLQAETFPENSASARVLAKCGFRERGMARRNYPARGGLVAVRVHVLHFATHDAGSTAGFGDESRA
jgi:RimJ/RimL family protein N-acetyltransferase